MAIKRYGAQRFSGIETDVGSLPIDADLVGAIFNSTDTLEFWIFDDTLTWNKISTGGGTATFQPAYQMAITDVDVVVEEIPNLWRLPIDFTSLSSITGYVEDAPTGSSITIVIKKNTVPEATLIIGTGSLTGSTSTFNTGSILTTDEITVEITTVGSTTPGTNLKLSIIDGAQSSTKSMQFAATNVATDLEVSTVNNVWRSSTLITTITEINAYVEVAPVGAAIILEVKKDGVTEGTVTIANGTLTGSTAVLTSGTIDFTNEITVEITQIGSTTPGQNLKVNILGS